MDQISGPPRNMLLQGMAYERQSSDIQVFGGLKVEIRAGGTLARGMSWRVLSPCMHLAVHNV